MDVAIIDWKSLDSRFIKDDLYEHINAPQWIDFSTPDESVDDEAWFCRPDCNHPKTVEDFMKKSPNSKVLLKTLLQRSPTISGILPFGGRNKRDSTLKKRGPTQPSMMNKDSKSDRFVEDNENQNPNLSTPPNQKAKFLKQSIKSSTEKKKIVTPSKKEETPKLKSTLSARNLFAGRDILNQITEFCNELKRLAMRTKERENEEKEGSKKEIGEFSGCDLKDLNEREKERKPLLEVVSTEKDDAIEKNILKEKQKRKKKTDETENKKPISVDLKTIRRNEKESLLQIRTNPPSPQCFSVNRGPTKPTLPKPLRSRPQERGILQELEQSNKEVMSKDEKKNNQEQSSVSAEKETKTLDVFWFLKPCTLSN